ncbi:MAG: phosphoesterase PA-phosphatase [Methanobacteriales archaeon HGW-Methanobacteriales-1]|jgi:membrane-associated phospholipid phosphatase|nr:MAG: phosphoesterase PA-phosphatase [Methanobacteriales archaeon HGW-Methanobacteriales-1]
MNNLKENKKYENQAQLISDFSNAPILAFIVFSIINFYYLNFNDFIKIDIISIFFASILPTAVIIVFFKKKNIHRDLLKKEDRKIPLIIAIISYFLGTIALFIMEAPTISTALMFCYFSNTIIVMGITRYWKISIHLMGISGPATGLIFAFGLTGAIFGLLGPLVMWSRVYLNRHTISQVLAGFLFGFILTAAQMILFLNLII